MQETEGDNRPMIASFSPFFMSDLIFNECLRKFYLGTRYRIGVRLHAGNEVFARAYGEGTDDNLNAGDIIHRYHSPFSILMSLSSHEA